MARIELKHLSKRDSVAIIDFLLRQYSTSVKVAGSAVEVEAVNDRDLRTMMKKFFHSSRREEYRVVSETGHLEVLSPKQERAHIKPDKRVTLPPSSTMPYYFQDTTVIRPPRKKQK